MIKLYPGGHFSGMLADGTLQAGDELELRGPYGVFTLRESDRPLVFIGGGAGMAPILSLLRSMAETGVARPAVYYYGAREEEDLFHLDELRALADAIPGLRFVPALSDAGWEGETGLITDVVDRCEADLAEVDAYLCGPTPMVDAATELLLRRGAPEARIHFDKFTTTADAEQSSPT
jgi:propane monooxygenase reductase subunit